MKATIKFRYTEMVIPARCRKARPKEGETTYAVNIREVEEQNAPIAFVVTEYDREPRKVRLYNGKLYRQVQDRQPQYMKTNKRDENRPFWLNQTAEAVNWQWLLGTRGGNWNGQMKCWDYRSQADNRDSIKKRAQEHIIVNGEAYKRTGEPYYHTICFGCGNNHGGTGFFIGWADYTDRKKIWGWTAADKKAATDKAAKVAANRGDTGSIDHILNPIEDIAVLMPEAIKRKYEHTY